MGAVWIFDRAGEQKGPWKRLLLYLLMGILLAFGYKIRATVILTLASVLIYAILGFRKSSMTKTAMNFSAAVCGMVLALAYMGRQRTDMPGSIRLKPDIRRFTGS